jgi:hypothetical protein
MEEVHGLLVFPKKKFILNVYHNLVADWLLRRAAVFARDHPRPRPARDMPRLALVADSADLGSAGWSGGLRPLVMLRCMSP